MSFTRATLFSQRLFNIGYASTYEERPKWWVTVRESFSFDVDAGHKLTLYMANMAVNRRELEELKSWVEETVKLRLGFSEKSVVNAALYCVTNNLDRSSSREKMTSLLDDLAPQFVTDLFEKLSEIKKSKNLVSGKSSLSRKRTLEDVFGDDNQEDRGESSHFIKSKRKQSRFDALKDDNVPLPPAMPETSDRPTPMSNRQISEMVASMKKQIEERKKQINVMKQTTIPSAQQVQVTSQVNTLHSRGSYVLTHEFACMLIH